MISARTDCVTVSNVMKRTVAPIVIHFSRYRIAGRVIIIRTAWTVTARVSYDTPRAKAGCLRIVNTVRNSYKSGFGWCSAVIPIELTSEIILKEGVSSVKSAAEHLKSDLSRSGSRPDGRCAVAHRYGYI